MPKIVRHTTFLLIAVMFLVLPVLADRTVLKPGSNLFSTQQDIEMGRALADEAESILFLIDESNSNAYISALGSQLAAHAPGARYPYQFKIVQDDAIDSFVLPGGWIYVTTGLFEAAESEPQLAGIIAHQIGHVALRHGTQQVSTAYRNRAGNVSRVRTSMSTVMADLNIHFDGNPPAILRHSIETERQADLIGAQIMHDAGFDPRQMSRMFQKIANQGAGLTRDFLSNHPNPANRAARVRTEMQNMGGLPRNLRGDSGDCHSIKDRLIAADTIPPRFNTGVGSVHSTGDFPSSRTVLYRGSELQFRYPENWRVDEQADGVYVIPDRGLVSGGLAYGMRIATFEPANNGLFGRTPFAVPGTSTNQTTLQNATDELLDELRRSNPNMRVVRTRQNQRVDGSSAMTLEISNDSPLGGLETNWLVTTLRPSGTLHYFVGVAPQREFNGYLPAFEQIVGSVRFTD